MVLGKLPPGEFPPEKFPPMKLPAGKSSRKIATQIIFIWNIPTYFIVFLYLTFRFDKFSQALRLQHF